MIAKTIIEVKGLKTVFRSDHGDVPAVNNVSFHINQGEILGVVGESGCGKSVTSLSLMGLVPKPGKITEGEILFNGNDLRNYSERSMRKIRGNKMAMIFQEPMTSLNPLFTIGEQLIEAIKLHEKLTKKQAKNQAVDVMKRVGLARPEELINEYPHQLSGGMRQRVMIAMAMACEPQLLIADEPTTALDVTIQAQILRLMEDLNQNFKTAIMMITHDLGVVAKVCQRIIVMYAGKVVEEGTVQEIFNNPKHPYTVGLIKSVPDIRKKADHLYSIPGNVPKPGSINHGCVFYDRCEKAMTKCHTETPELYKTLEGNQVRCFLHEHQEGVNQ